jgi:hypothetical protein
MQIDPQLSIELVSEDTGFEQVRITAGNGQYGGSALVNFGHGNIAALAEALQGFPKTSSQVEVFEGGSDEGSRAKLIFSCKERVSRAVVTVSLVEFADENAQTGIMNEVKLELRYEAWALDEFCKELEAIGKRLKKRAVLMGFASNKAHAADRSSGDATRALVVKHTFYAVVGWVGIVFFMLGGVMAWRTGARGSSLLFLGFVALSSFLVLNSGSMQVDSDSIKYYLPFRRFQIKWNEVKYIEIDSQAGNMVFVGENKRLATNGPKLWTGKDKNDAGKLMSAQIDRYGIELRQTEMAMFRLSRNTKWTRA